MGKKEDEPRIILTPDELSVVSEMFMKYAEDTDYDEGYIMDKRHSIDNRKAKLRYAYEKANRIKLAQFLFGEAKVVGVEDEDLPWVDCDLQNIWYPSPMLDVARIARMAGLQDYFNELEEGKES